MEYRLVEWIESERKRRGWSKRDLAREAQVTAAQVSDVLKGRSNPGVRFYIGLCKAFHVPVDYLLQLAGKLPPGPEPEENPTLMEITEIARRLPPDLQNDLKEYAKWRSRQAAEARPGTLAGSS